MSQEIRIRAYIVGFGDCILLSLPDGNKTRHLLFDFGRAPNDSASLERFPAIAADIKKECGGRLDLLVMTHEHLDHMEGFYREREVFNSMTVDRVWMSLPSHPKYYTDFPKAKLQKKLRAGLTAFAADARRNGLVLHPGFISLLENNLANKDRVEYLRNLGKKPVAYLARGKSASPGFSNVKIRVLAPEPDVSVYYSASARENAMTAALAAASGSEADREGLTWTFPDVPRATANQLGGVSRSDFERLRRSIREDGVAMARFIDRAQNNTSLCLMIEAGGKRLLLPGDAELESWDVMKKKCAAELKKPVDFLKVSHHGSHNGTPLELLDSLLPVRRKQSAQVLVSTKKNVYGTKNPVPDTSLLDELARRSRKVVTTDGKPGTHVDLSF
ncbi:ComEC/Rec2 family competence protein [Dongia sp.]|uniref:ComEC/Rec2 family competence protein n=1 Tax=Dongia sp. TaxID=1977262 RepID=UPI0037510352